MPNEWKPTDLLKAGASTIKVMRAGRMGVKDGVDCWKVIPSIRYSKKTGLHMIVMVPETNLRPLNVNGGKGDKDKISILDLVYEEGKSKGVWTVELLISCGWMQEAEQSTSVVDRTALIRIAACSCLIKCEKDYVADIAACGNSTDHVYEKREFLRGKIEAARESLVKLIKEGI